MQKPVPRSEERCELCNVVLGEGHRHLVERETRRIVCACMACALLFEAKTARFALVPRDATLISDFVLEDLQWESLGIPISLAFFFHNSSMGKTIALYPSPGGATESLLPLDSWEQIVENNPVLKPMQPDVEALLANRLAAPHEYYIAPIDRCYELVGIVRKYWQGFSGGEEVWKHMDEFFARLRPQPATEASVDA
ncbi:MAG TPA: DUF5947 family protein [Terriglobales bacterium]|nr:DUF5947 family protein [Terriglobales bacterium]